MSFSQWPDTKSYLPAYIAVQLKSDIIFKC